MTHSFRKEKTTTTKKAHLKETSSGVVVARADVLNDLICKQTLALSRTIRRN